MEATDGVALSLLGHDVTKPLNDVYSRRILLFLTGTSNAPPNEFVSIYLTYADPKSAPEGWYACAQFAFVLSNVHDPGTSVVNREF